MTERLRPSPDNEHKVNPAPNEPNQENRRRYLFGFKRKHAARIFAAGEIGIGFLFLTSAAHTADPSELPLIISELFTRVALGGGSILFLTDGAVDFVKGTHHYLPLQVWKRLTKNEARKAEIDASIKRFLETREEKISLF